MARPISIKARAIASNIAGYRAVWISTQRLRDSENGENSVNGKRQRKAETQRSTKQKPLSFVVLCVSAVSVVVLSP